MKRHLLQAMNENLGSDKAQAIKTLSLDGWDFNQGVQIIDKSSWSASQDMEFSEAIKLLDLSCIILPPNGEEVNNSILNHE